MATTTARLNLSSPDLVSDNLSLVVSAEFNAAGTTTGLTETTGLRRQTMASTAETKLIEEGDYTDDTSNWLYFKNTSSTATRYVDITIGSIGSSIKLARVYNGEWALIPYAGNADVNVQVNNTDIILEWMLIHA